MKTKKVLIINQCAGNKGDRSVLYNLLNLFDKHDNIEITVSTSNVSDWKDTFTGKIIKFVPWGWFINPNADSSKRLKFLMIRIFRKLTYVFTRFTLINNLNSKYIGHLINPEFKIALQETDLVISTGGHHITTILSKNAVTSQIFDLACSIIYKKKVVVWSQSIGPLDFDSQIDKKFVECILSRLDSVYVRDKRSIGIAEKFGCDPKNIHLTSETVLSLNKRIDNYTPIANRKDRIGISIYSTGNRTKIETEKYIEQVSQLIDYSYEKTKNEIVFLPMELKNSRGDDRWLIKKIIEKTVNKNYCSIYDQDMNTYDHFKFIQNCKYFIGHKTHSVIYALAAGTPLIALAYHPKTIDFMTQFEVEKYAIADTELTTEKYISCFNNLVEEANFIGNKIFNKSKLLSQEIQIDFDKLIKENLYR